VARHREVCRLSAEGVPAGSAARQAWRRRPWTRRRSWASRCSPPRGACTNLWEGCRLSLDRRRVKEPPSQGPVRALDTAD